jgi:16S rRNA (guanine966-N2)-methyltransferase
MTRIIAGRARGRRLEVPPVVTRPTSDRVREAVFSSVGHQLGGWPGRCVLDLFAGSGAMGLEAASRGASPVLLVEQDRRALAVIRRNVAAVGVDAASVLAADATKLAARTKAAPGLPEVDLLLVDPPYDHDGEEVARVLSDLRAGCWLAPDSLTVVERSAHGAAFRWPPGWTPVTDRRYGQTGIHLGRLVASVRSPGEESS